MEKPNPEKVEAPKAPTFSGLEAGATGLEPTTCGVTGRSLVIPLTPTYPA